MSFSYRTFHFCESTAKIGTQNVEEIGLPEAASMLGKMHGMSGRDVEVKS